MADGNAPVEAGQRCRQHGRRVALDQRHVRPDRFQRAVDPFQEPCRQSGERLVRTHDIEVGVHRDAECVRDLAEHLLVLSGGDDGAPKILGFRSATTTGASFTASGRVPMKTRMFRMCRHGFLTAH